MTDTVSASMKIAGAKAAEGFGVILSFEQTAAIYRAMLAASPQGQSSSGDWIKHDGGPNPVPGKTVEGQYPGETRVFHGPSEGVVWGRGVIYRVTEGVNP